MLVKLKDGSIVSLSENEARNLIKEGLAIPAPKQRKVHIR